MSMQPEPQSEPLRERLRAAIPVAMKARDRRTVSALRSALGAIDNAEAVEVDTHVRAGAIEASPYKYVGAGVSEVARRVLTEADIVAIVRAEVADRRVAAANYEATGHRDRAAELAAEADALAAHLG